MSLEIFTFITSLVRTNPTGTDGVNQGDDHIRGVKLAVQDSFPNVDAACPFTPTEINSWEARILALEATGLLAAVQPFAAVPDGVDTTWLLCDGQAVLRATYVALFGRIGVVYGNGDNTTTFNVPDYRGEFLRGTDGGAGNDPDAAGRTDRGDGVTGDAVGTKQAGEVEAHTHGNSGDHDHTYLASVTAPESSSSSGSTTGNTATSTTDTGRHEHDSVGGAENRPRNVGVLYYIHV